MKLLTENTPVEDLLISGEVFVAKDLFRPIEWKRLSHQTRRDLGRKFWDYIDSRNGESTPLEKTMFNQQKYKRN